MADQVHLKSGRQISVREIRQRGTYEGLLEGLPTVEKNKKLVARLSADKAIASYGVPPVVLPAVERPIEIGDPYPFGTPAALPPVTVIARFSSLKPTQSGKGDGSGLTVVWFQDEFSWPPAVEILSQLQLLDWESLAGDFEY